jgi:hypothetical protein
VKKKIRGARVVEGDAVLCGSEEEIFHILGLQYRSPTDRNTFPYPEDYVNPDGLDATAGY